VTSFYGGIEGGGTKFVCAVGTDPQHIVQEIRIPTTVPDETLPQVVAFFKRYSLRAIGFGSFGPLDLDATSPTYGSITATPKAGWSGTNVLSAIRRELDIPFAFDLDVNAAAFGEYCLVPENQGLDSLVYITIGTGIGAGVIVHGKIVHGLTHPEAGHMLLPHDRERDPFPGICPFHQDCFEGLASGPALSARWMQAADMLPDEHPAWELEAEYIAAALANIILTVSPQRIVLGGGVMERGFLFPLIRSKVKSLLNQYIASPELAGELEHFIIPPGLGNKSGVMGALAMAKEAEKNLP
jgi:fructokinase